MVKTYKSYRNACRFNRGEIVAVNGGKAFAARADLVPAKIIAKADAAPLMGGSVSEPRFDRTFAVVEFSAGGFGFVCELTRGSMAEYQVYENESDAVADFEATAARYASDSRWAMR